MKKYQFKFWAPLINFHTDSIFKINKDVEIVMAGKYEKEIISKCKDNWQNIHDFLLCITIEKNTPEEKPREHINEAREIIEKIVTLFRLFKQEPIGYNLIIQPYSDKSYAYSAKGILHYVLWAAADQKSLGEIYKLKKEKDDFCSFAAEYYGLSTWTNLELAIEYFNKSYIEPYTPRDSFLDIVICLENLLLKESKNELKYKLALRMAHFLGESMENRKQIFESTKKAYDLRSNVVHGAKGNVNEQNLLGTRDFARKVLKEFLKHIDFWSEKKLDEIIMDGTFYPKHKITR